jgi:hypothetical protein
MGKTTDEKQNKPNAKGNIKPNMVVGNPDMEYSGRSTDLRNIRDKGHSAGSPRSESRDGMAGNYNHPDDEKDQNKAGHVRNQSDEEQNASDNVDSSDSRPISKKSGAEGKTMVKNVGMNNLQGQQEGGNHGGGNAANKKSGNQSQGNSARRLSRNQDGDYKGHK